MNIMHYLALFSLRKLFTAPLDRYSQRPPKVKHNLPLGTYSLGSPNVLRDLRNIFYFWQGIRARVVYNLYILSVQVIIAVLQVPWSESSSEQFLVLYLWHWRCSSAYGKTNEDTNVMNLRGECSFPSL